MYGFKYTTLFNFRLISDNNQINLVRFSIKNKLHSNKLYIYLNIIHQTNIIKIQKIIIIQYT
jgi:hypothetical protein